MIQWNIFVQIFYTLKKWRLMLDEHAVAGLRRGRSKKYKSLRILAEELYTVFLWRVSWSRDWKKVLRFRFPSFGSHPALKIIFTAWSVSFKIWFARTLQSVRIKTTSKGQLCGSPPIGSLGICFFVGFFGLLVTHIAILTLFTNVGKSKVLRRPYNRANSNWISMIVTSS